MKEFEVFFHGIGRDNVKLIRVQEDFLIVDALKVAKDAGVVDILDEACEIFLEENDENAAESDNPLVSLLREWEYEMGSLEQHDYDAMCNKTDRILKEQGY